MPVSILIEGLLELISVIACEMVGNNIDNNLDAIFFSSIAEVLEFFLSTQITCLYFESKRLIEPVPYAGIRTALSR